MKRLVIFIFLQCILVSGYAQSKNKKSLQELTDGNPAWNQVLQMKAKARNVVEFLPAEPARADSALLESQFSTSSYLGSIIHRTGGVLIDNGWIRILGSGNSRLDRSLPSWNKGKSIRNKPTYAFLLVADDVLGGFFALKTDANVPTDSCTVYYFGPNSLKWKPTGFNYRTFLAYCFSGNITRFYSDFRWTGWEQEVTQINGNQAISCFPLLWTREGLELKANRKVKPIQKVWESYPQQTKFLAETN